ncbi:unnamed protein product [Kuraishia capsulata CBS 1993]|uniref:ER membrane protein complex subunit 2 n=1 Tax=Kuraishia capsulata CBS 1993 TaxID=1382522 RepID=W6MIQ2_9ASCO|nr:uncharacterized protein KUCA_T00002341001 [Kuraishia capsulata CBS 1993]CDK26369.1 unnamed protein product [Kuraishia capsulata CBS 1993]
MSLERLLEIHRSGLYATLPLHQIDSVYTLTKATLLTQLSDFERFTLLELQFYLTLTMGLDIEAKHCLDLICDRFDITKSERICVLKSVYVEATTGSTLREVSDGLVKDAKELVRLSNIAKSSMGGKLNIMQDLMAVTKRVVALHHEDVKEYTEKLALFLDLQPLDTESWYEMSEVYLANGNTDQAIHCLSEILLTEPFAYNVWSRIGEVQLMTGFKTSDSQRFEEAKRHFARSCELCETYHRGWLGLLESAKRLGDKKLVELSRTQLDKIVSGKLTSAENIDKISQILAN